MRSPAPLRVKDLHPPHVIAALARDPRLIVPIGGCQPIADTLPMGCDTLILESLADDLSAQFQVLRAPTLEYGVTVPSGATLGHPGAIGGSVRKMTLHRMLNDLLMTWEAAGVREFILLSADGADGHQDALATVVTAEARVRVIDIFAISWDGVTRNEVRHTLLTGEIKGHRWYEQIHQRIAERVFERMVDHGTRSVGPS